MPSNAPLDDVVSTLAASGLGLTAGTNLFGSLLPDSPDLSTAVTEYPAGESDEVFQVVLPAVELSRFQILTRDIEANYAANQSRIEAIYRFVLTQVNVTIGGTFYQRWTPLHRPSFLHRDEKRRIHHVLNIMTERTPI